MDRLHCAPLQTMALLKFKAMSDLDREAYGNVGDPQALIAFTDRYTWIIEGDMLRVIEVSQSEMLARQQYFVLEPVEPEYIGNTD